MTAVKGVGRKQALKEKMGKANFSHLASQNILLLIVFVVFILSVGL